MPATSGIRWNQVKTGDRHGTTSYGQASDGTGASGNVPMFNDDGSLTDSGKAASSIGSGPSGSKYTTSWTLQTSVTVTHNLSTAAVIIQVFDAGGNLAAPESVSVTSADVVTLTFGAPFSGSVVVMSAPSSKATASWTSQTSITVTHHLGTVAVIVQVFDANLVSVQPESMAVTSANAVTLSFGTAFTGSVVVMG